jgi:hypothetical protein
MLSWPVSPGASGAISALLGAWAALHFFGFLFGRVNADGTSRTFPPAKMAASAALVLCAAVFWLDGARGTFLAPFSALICFGMFFGFLGDLTLAGFLRLPQQVMFGMLWFGIGHILYILGFGFLALGLFGVAVTTESIVAVLVWMVIAAVIWRVLVASPKTPPVLNYGALGYGLLLGAMTGVATGLALQHAAFIGTAIGAALFLLSDMILGNVMFRENRFPLAHDLIWLLYIVGQLFIVFTNAVALRLIAGL